MGTHTAHTTEPSTPGAHHERDLLRLATAGSVDDGKSTLIGRLLYDTKSVLADQLAAVERASQARGGDAVDLALLTDGLRAEREQGITIDVAYRYFSTATRAFVLADTPGHVQYTRNMVTGASTAELAIVLVDARHGVVQQTRRHAALAALLRVPHVVLAVNKMDLVDYSQEAFTAIAEEFSAYAAQLGVTAVRAIPVSALTGDNVVERSTRMPWHAGPTLLEHLEQVPVHRDAATEPFRFPVQYVIRPRTAEHPDYRGYAGRITSGSVRVGDEVATVPGGVRSRVAGIDTFDGPLAQAHAPRSVTLRLEDDVDVARGDTLVATHPATTVGTDLAGTVCWLAQAPGAPGARVLVRTGTRTVRGVLQEVGPLLDVDTLRLEPVSGPLALNAIARVRLHLAEPVLLDEFADHRRTGTFLLIDPLDGATLAAGMAGRSPLASSVEVPGRCRAQ
ncbi:sulfate adenylyltransferase subunit 1 [Cellulomonas chengniuliangii]|uniref:sulfate adenylyltransferase n=1 Tax=Cellulomonas chengniuliangii TaxID=2968084 RepID=A0ABY5KZV2_9CELL|nr:GTP-binding protein [Cellulomonas chengniuliangii]MCC2308534.1 50S ribosome-binding GTPase [Cellulomonas chengniuliangii]UUI73898.1 GTP-binding protein [Cellulomonas chengniuliangii]